jgi:hypothetical protein
LVGKKFPEKVREKVCGKVRDSSVNKKYFTPFYNSLYRADGSEIYEEWRCVG